MDAWLIMGLLGWMVSWALVCAARVVRLDVSGTTVGVLWGAMMLGFACVWAVRMLRERRRVSDREADVSVGAEASVRLRAQNLGPSSSVHGAGAPCSGERVQPCGVV